MPDWLSKSFSWIGRVLVSIWDHFTRLLDYMWPFTAAGVAAAGTLAAAIVAVWIYWAGKRDARTQNARLVYATVERAGLEHYVKFKFDGPGLWLMEKGVFEELQTDQEPSLIRVVARIQNDSPEIMRNILLTLSDYDDRIPEPTGFVVRSVAPSTALVVTFLLRHDYITEGKPRAHIPDIAPSVSIKFSDSAGMHWRRDEIAAVRRIRHGYPTMPNLTTALQISDKKEFAQIFPGTVSWPIARRLRRKPRWAEREAARAYTYNIFGPIPPSADPPGPSPEQPDHPPSP